MHHNVVWWSGSPLQVIAALEIWLLHKQVLVTIDRHHARPYIRQWCRAGNQRKQDRLQGARRQLADARAECEAEARQLGDVVADDARLETMLQVSLLSAQLRE